MKLAKLPARITTRPPRIAAPTKSSPIMVDTGSAERQKLYRTQQWLRLRRSQLQQFPLCCECEREGVLRAAVVADHRAGHRGDWRARFFDPAALQSLCLEHHRAKLGLEYAEWLRA
jgi:hypothetical protein